MRLWVQKSFDGWAKDHGLTDDVLIAAGAESFAGQVDGDLGGYLFKKRIARAGGGKSGGFRTILCFRKTNSERIFFLHGFPKNDIGNISAREEKALRLVAKSLVDLTDAQLNTLEVKGALRALKVGQDEKTQ